MNIIYITGILSLIIQIITGIFDYYILNLQITPNLKLLRELLFVEFIVQLVEGCFYIWMVMNFSKISNITPNRYFDWFFTTPTMLITYSIYLIYLNNNYEDNYNNISIINENEVEYKNSGSIVFCCISSKCTKYIG